MTNNNEVYVGSIPEIKVAYKTPNPVLLQMQVLKAKTDDMKFLELKEFRKYSKLDTTLFTFNRGFKPFAINKSSKKEVPMQNMNYHVGTFKERDKEYDKWIVCKLYLPVDEFNLTVIKDAYCDQYGKSVSKLGVFAPKKVLFNIDTPRLDGEESIKLKNYIKQSLFQYYFRPMVDYASDFDNLLGPVNVSTGNTRPFYFSLSRKNWTFVKEVPKEDKCITATPYYTPYTKEEFK
jgi:hypothetical protein